MVTWDAAVAVITSLPEVTEGTRWRNQAWSVGGKVFAWERPLTKADVKRYGDVAPPEGPLFALSVEDLGEKEAVLAAGGPGVFTIPHFDNFAAVLVQLDVVSTATLRELIEDAWAMCAPSDVVARHRAE